MSDEIESDQSAKTWRHRFRESWDKSILGTVEKRARFCEWGLHNVVLGFAGVWMPFLALAFFGYLRWRESLLDGDLAMFAVTASAVSLGFFVKETQVSLRKTEMFTYAGLMITMIIGIVTRTALAFADQFSSAAPLQLGFLGVITCALVLCAIGFNFRLFTLELAVLSREQIRERLSEPVREMAEQARENNEASGVKL
jgi:hypothetical protein